MNELYEGREQAFIKHKVLESYLVPFAQIIGTKYPSISYVDCFAGPWESRSDQFKDTSFSLVLEKLREARQSLGKRGRTVDLRCLFIESNKAAFEQLAKFCSEEIDIPVRPLKGEFQISIGNILEFLKESPGTFAFCFIDPTGWKDIPLQQMVPLLRYQPGEVLVNFMTSFIRRFPDDPSLDKLYGDSEFRQAIKGLSGDALDSALIDEYCSRIKKSGDFAYVSAALVAKPKSDAAHYHLIYGSRSIKGLQVFKDAEKSAVKAMTDLRLDLSLDEFAKRQNMLFLKSEVYSDIYLERMRRLTLAATNQDALRILDKNRRVLYEELLGALLRRPLVWESDVKKMLESCNGVSIRFEGFKPGQRVPRVNEGNYVTNL